MPRSARLPCSAGTTTPFPPPFSSSLIPPREISPDCALTPSCHTTCKPLMKATPHQPLLWLPFVCGSNKQYSNQKPQNTPSPPPAPTPNHELKPDAIPRGQLSGRPLCTPPTLLTYPCFFPPSLGSSFLLLSQCEQAQITDMDQ